MNWILGWKKYPLANSWHDLPRSRYHQETCMTAQSSGLTHREAEKWSKGVQSPAPTCSVTFCTWLIKGRDRPPAAPPTPAGQADNSGLALLGVLTQCSFANYKVWLCRFLEPEYDLASDLVDRILAVR